MTIFASGGGENASNVKLCRSTTTSLRVRPMAMNRAQGSLRHCLRYFLARPLARSVLVASALRTLYLYCREHGGQSTSARKERAQLGSVRARAPHLITHSRGHDKARVVLPLNSEW